MKQLHLFIILLFFAFNVKLDAQNKAGQQQQQQQQFTNVSNTSGTKPKKQIKTTVFTINLGNPDVDNVMNSSDNDKLVFINKSPIQVKLINGNPFKYKYSLNYKAVNLFFNEDLIPFSSTGIEIDENEVSADDLVAKAALTTDALINTEQDKLLKLVMDLKVSLNGYIKNLKNQEELDFAKFDKKRNEFRGKFDKFLGQDLYLDNQIENLAAAPTALTLENQKELNQLLVECDNKLSMLMSANTSKYLYPIDVNGDNIDYVEITLQRTNMETSIVENPYVYKLWIRGGVKIDFSGGAFISSIFDNSFVLTNALDDMGNPNGKQIILEQDTGNYDFGFGTMVNISLRGGSWVKPSLNVGALFTNNQKFQLLTGLGFIIGKKERLIFHTGLSMGRVSVLQDNFVADNQTEYDLGQNGAVPLVDKFKFGHFFGVTYNFSKPKPQSNE